MEFPEPGFHIVLQISVGDGENYLIDWMLLKIDLIMLLTGWTRNHFYERVEYTNQCAALITFIQREGGGSHLFC
jgi:hypothetical protein